MIEDHVCHALDFLMARDSDGGNVRPASHRRVNRDQPFYLTLEQHSWKLFQQIVSV
jgi:hypothetical protein